MELDKVILLIINTIDVSQAISIGAFLIIVNRSKKNALFLLGLFLMVMGVSSLSDLFDFFNVYLENPYLNLLSFNAMFILPVVLYIYVGKCTSVKSKIKAPTKFGRGFVLVYSKMD